MEWSKSPTRQMLMQVGWMESTPGGAAGGCWVFQRGPIWI